MVDASHPGCSATSALPAHADGGDTGHVAISEQEWSDRVSEAAVAGDGPALRTLFAEGHALFGQRADHLWSVALSGLDAAAQTG